jgi:hypothetical protein
MVGFLIAYVLLSFFGTLAIVLLVGWLIKTIRRRLLRWWMRSPLRARYRGMSKAKLSFLTGLVGNSLEVLLCLPLLGVPPGSGIKPMTLPVLMLLIAAATAVSCHRVSEDARRPDGSKLLHFVGNCLCLLPFFVGVFVMHLFAAMLNLTFG